MAGYCNFLEKRHFFRAVLRLAVLQKAALFSVGPKQIEAVKKGGVQIEP
ncbi:hypothetical protein CCACVL1_27132 [Corchorus capsularis]|uniref:Uncharacterized protein n=1 Tax=Corchorus capsularis TaxID=210143 RepID=A0A1R3GC14_COCAP|nr:hypothetical protein CCACVL1_27132 [Corchorus capsularis]